MFNGYVLYLQAVTTPNPFVKLPKLPFHKSLLLIFCLRLRFPFSFFKLFFAVAALVISHGGFGYFPRLWLFSRGGSGYFPRRLWVFSQGGSGYFPGVSCFSGGSGYFPGVAPVIFPRRLWLFPTAALVIFPGWLRLFFRGGLVIFPRWRLKLSCFGHISTFIRKYVQIIFTFGHMSFKFHCLCPNFI